MKTRIGLVGCGSIGKRHAAVIDAEQNAELVAVCDIDKEQIDSLTALYQDLKGYVQLEEMLEQENIEILIIATPHHLHCEMTVLACNAGVSVLVEKPMALTSEECNRMNKAAEQNHVNLWVVKQNRFNVPVQLTKDALDKKMLGQIFMVKCDILWNRYPGYYNTSPWRGSKEKEGGALFTLGSHFIDLLLMWFGNIREANGFSALKNHAIEIEDVGLANVEFENGILGQISWTTCVYNKNYEGSITIIGENGTIKIGGKYLNKIEYWDVNGYPLQEGVEYIDKPNLYGKYQGTSSNHDKVIHALCQKVRKEQFEIVDGIEGKRTVDATELIYNGLIEK